MKQFITGEFTDHTSMYGYQKKVAYVHLVSDGEEIGQHNVVGYIKTEPILDEDGKLTGEVFYYRGNCFPRNQARYFTTARALLNFLQTNFKETAEDEADALADEFGMLDGEETYH